MGEREEQPHLSGAYIRSLVKQLSYSSRVKGGDGSTMSSPNPENGENPKDNNSNNTSDKAKKVTEDRASEENKTQTVPHKKQVRRRLHTTRPYQERLLNMAEARREIVTALKIHRAAMKQAKEKQHQQHMQLQQQQLQLPNLTQPSIPLFEPYQECPLNYNNIPNYLYNTNNSPFTYPSFSWPWSQSTTAPITPFLDNFNLDLPLPSQPLGLNLNFQGFNSINNTSFSNNQHNKPPTQPSPTASSNSQSYSSATPQIYEAPQLYQHQINSVSSLHPVMDEEEMAEIYSIGEKHDIEWNDTVNLVTSAWWSKFLKTLEGEEGEISATEGVESKGSSNYVLDEALNAPMCFDDVLGQEVNNATSSTFEEQVFGYYQADHMDADLPK